MHDLEYGTSRCRIRKHLHRVNLAEEDSTFLSQADVLRSFAGRGYPLNQQAVTKWTWLKHDEVTGRLTSVTAGTSLDKFLLVI